MINFIHSFMNKSGNAKMIYNFTEKMNFWAFIILFYKYKYINKNYLILIFIITYSKKFL